MLPIFYSHYSLNRSILTVDAPVNQLTNDAPISILSIAQIYKLTDIHIVDTSFSGFVDIFKNSQKAKLNVCFGIELVICQDMQQKDPASLLTESKVIVWMRNTEGYRDLMLLYSKAATEGYYHHNRLDWATLDKMLTPDLIVTIPFYSSFLARNILQGYNCLPHFTNYQPIFLIEQHELPFDQMLCESVQSYVKTNNNETINSHSIYYYSYEDIMAYQAYKCVTENWRRTSLERPQLDHFCSNAFCWEHFCKLNKNIKFIHAS